MNDMSVKDWVAVVGGVITIMSVTLVALAKLISWAGKKASAYVKYVVMPPIDALTTSVNNLAERTHENTETIADFTSDQKETNERTALQVAELRGAIKALSDRDRADRRVQRADTDDHGNPKGAV